MTRSSTSTQTSVSSRSQSQQEEEEERELDGLTRLHKKVFGAPIYSWEEELAVLIRVLAITAFLVARTAREESSKDS